MLEFSNMPAVYVLLFRAETLEKYIPIDDDVILRSDVIVVKLSANNETCFLGKTCVADFKYYTNYVTAMILLCAVFTNFATLKWNLLFRSVLLLNKRRVNI